MKTTTSEPRVHAPALALLLALLLVNGACADGGEPFEFAGWQYRSDAVTQWALPKPLVEVSGLALDPAGRLFAHGDERARIYQIDYVSGAVVKHFDLGDPAAPGDFEGIAWVEDSLYLVTSDGVLYQAREGEDGSHVAFDRQDTGLGRLCEIEGLHYDSVDGVLLMPCKAARAKDLEDRIVILAWSLRSGARAADRELRSAKLSARLNPSGITRSPRSGHVVLVAARQRALVELTAEGELGPVTVFPQDGRHPQMEGIAITTQGQLIVADEGGKQRGRLSVYTPGR